MFTIIGAVVYPINSPSPPLFIFETSTAHIGINNATYDTAATRSRRETMTLGFEPCLAMPTTDAPAVKASGMNPKQNAVTVRGRER
jgi:hypothetical protein